MSLKEELAEARKFGKLFKSTRTSNGITIDENNRLWKHGIFGEIHSFEDIIDVDIFENGTSISKTSTSSMLGRAALGSLINPVGAIIGGVTAKRKHIEIVNSIEVIVTIKSVRKPMLRINVPISKGTKKDSKSYLRSIQKAQEIQATFYSISHR